MYCYHVRKTLSTKTAIYIDLVTALTLVIQCVQITKLVVPEIVSPSDAPVILDCDYTLQSSSDDELIVKWFFGDPIKLVYQWIPNIQPQALGEFNSCII